eukprot:4187304-Prymnesium_polylepis.1
MSVGGTPAARAAVAPPMRRLCAPKRAGSSPMACISALIIVATSRREIALSLASRKRGVAARSVGSTRSSRNSSSSSST